MSDSDSKDGTKRRQNRREELYSSSEENPRRRDHDRRTKSNRHREREPTSAKEKHHSRRHRHHREHDLSRQDGDGNSSRRDRRYRERSASRERSRHHDRSKSPPVKRRRRSDSDSRSPAPSRKSRAPLPSQNESFRGGKDVASAAAAGEGPAAEKQKPNYKPTGLLAKEANTVVGTTTVLKYHEPPEARKPSPKEQWRMYVFKQKDLLDTVYLHQRSVWLMGRDQAVTDMLLEHPSISKQHAVIQFRYITTKNEFGDKQSKVKPYLIDLESANGTKLNGKKVEASRFVELVDGDVVAFGDSEREYVLMLPTADK